MKRFLLSITLMLCVIGGAYAVGDKKVSILGDSYSTFEGCVEPATNVSWYLQKMNPDRTDVAVPEQTWWKLFLDQTGYKLEQNNSYSGSTICHRGYHGDDYSKRSFITRMSDLGNPDIILVFGATNDFWAKVALTPETAKNPEPHALYTFQPAMEYMLQQLGALYPESKVYFILNDEINGEIREMILKACADYSVPCIELTGIKKQAGHPNQEGMKEIANQIAKAIKQ
ncbi:MAG: SGNH/GDSL hydrolase family protein [Duncaniella sp.]|nr:SGNH/GDSL hydrolase family protein [Muribaculum sp.]MCM1255416.1 SGNH/GDSL hydrolase family protein [Duncaniella sp.]